MEQKTIEIQNSINSLALKVGSIPATLVALISVLTEVSIFIIILRVTVTFFMFCFLGWTTGYILFVLGGEKKPHDAEEGEYLSAFLAGEDDAADRPQPQVESPTTVLEPIKEDIKPITEPKIRAPQLLESSPKEQKVIPITPITEENSLTLASAPKNNELTPVKLENESNSSQKTKSPRRLVFNS